MGYPTGKHESELLAELANKFADMAAAELLRGNPIQVANALIMAAAIILAGLGRTAEQGIERWWRRTAPSVFKGTLQTSFPPDPTRRAHH